VPEELQTTIFTIYRPQEITVEILKAIQKAGIPIYNKNKYRNLKRVNKLIKLYIEFPKPDLKNVLFSNITKSKELIKQKQTPNLFETTGQYKEFIKPIGQISENQRNDPIENQIERVKNTDY